VGQCSTPHPCRCTRGKQSRYLLCRRLCGPHGRSERAWKTENLLPSSWFGPRTIQPAVNGSTDNATFHNPPPPHNNMKHTKFSKYKRNICIKICPFGLLRRLFLPPVYRWFLRHATSWFYETRSLQPDQIVSVLLDIAMFLYDTQHNSPRYT